MILSEGADALEAIDDKAALKLLDRASEVLKAHPDLVYVHSDTVIRTLAAIEPDKARALVRKGWGDQRDLAAGFALRHPDLAAPLMSEDSLGETVDDLARIRVDLGISFLSKVKGVDRTYFAASTARSLDKAEAARIIAAFGSPTTPKSFWSWRDAHPNASAREIEQQARQSATRHEVAVGLIEALQVSLDPRLADELCRAAMAPKAQPFDSSYGPINQEDVLLPHIGIVDTPTVRQYLSSLESEPKVDQASLSAAWSYLDADHALRILDAAIANRRARLLGAHGQTLEDDYKVFLKNLARTRPEEAAKRLEGQRIVSSVGEGSDDQGMNYLYACQIVRANWKTHPEATIRFFSHPTKYIHQFDGDPKDVIEALRLAEAARANPTESSHYLRRLGEILPDWEVLLDTGMSKVVVDVVGQVAATDTPRAIELSRIDFRASEQNDALSRAIQKNRSRADEQLKPLAVEARTVCLTIAPSAERAFCLLYLAGSAKLKWQRGQSWPMHNVDP